MPVDHGPMLRGFSNVTGPRDAIRVLLAPLQGVDKWRTMNPHFAGWIDRRYPEDLPSGVETAARSGVAFGPSLGGYVGRVQ